MQALRTSRFRYRYKQISLVYQRFLRNFYRIQCKACENREYSIVMIQKPFWVEKCTTCGMGRTLPIRTIKSQEQKHFELYSKENYINNYLENYAPYLKNSFIRGLQRLKKYAPAGTTLLDVGCGFGYFLNLARDAGYLVEGIEVSKTLTLEAKSRFDINIESGSILEINPNRAFNILTAWDMLEHVIDINQMLNKFKECLTPDGLLLLRVPDFSFMQNHLPIDFLASYTKNVFPLSINQHYHHFSRQSLEIFLSKAGFKVLEWWPSQDDEYTPRNNPEYVELLKKMRQYGIACELNLIAKRLETEQSSYIE